MKKITSQDSVSKMGTTRARKNNRLAAALAMGLLALSSISCGKDSDQNLAPSPFV